MPCLGLELLYLLGSNDSSDEKDNRQTSNGCCTAVSLTREWSFLLHLFYNITKFYSQSLLKAPTTSDNRHQTEPR